jgi:hypothetical protein
MLPSFDIRLIQRLALTTALCILFLLATNKSGYAQDVTDAIEFGPFVALGPIFILGALVIQYRREAKLRKKIQPAYKTRSPQDADVTVFAPQGGRPLSVIIVQVVIHTPEREDEARRRTQTVDSTSQKLASTPLTIQLRMGDKIKVTLECDGALNSAPRQFTKWNGRLVSVNFTLKLPNEPEPLTLISKVRVFVNAVPAADVIFKINVVPTSDKLERSVAPTEVRAYRKPFLSYAHEDRVQVLRAAQVIGALKMEFFQDVLKITPGERWERRLYLEIERCDVFLLFWSRHAKASRWVVREAEYALQISKNVFGQPIEIVPILLDGPPPPVPPLSLREIQFYDPIKCVIFAEEKMIKKSGWGYRVYVSRLFRLTVGLLWLMGICALVWYLVA